jgi:hypothetical protein
MKHDAARYIPGATMIAVTILSIALVGAGLALAGYKSWALVAMGSMIYAGQAIDTIAGSINDKRGY